MATVGRNHAVTQHHLTAVLLTCTGYLFSSIPCGTPSKDMRPTILQASKTTRPSSTVMTTRVSRMAWGSIAQISLSRTTRSALLPGKMPSIHASAPPRRIDRGIGTHADGDARCQQALEGIGVSAFGADLVIDQIHVRHQVGRLDRNRHPQAGHLADILRPYHLDMFDPMRQSAG